MPLLRTSCSSSSLCQIQTSSDEKWSEASKDITVRGLRDSPAGIKAAVAAELAVVGVLAGNPRASLLEAGASFVIESFDDPALWKPLGDEDPFQR
ncbi:hypothetical protein AXG93_215s1040 [Marchantia polymorpha subsp. ruderalis]|uniref:Uncharacterized protein n=1 Tax=Marchantia polymorpha subsp. ruderalis TaxID=1480154 RepID=A0A176W160_MARPO|nr:hypothetical protein AXG93_215s1040 [Marchantia polymorpha subsp. ruderalis]